MKNSVFKVFITVIFYFFLYALLGWFIDTCYSSFVDGRLVFGGMFKSFFLTVPLAPIYGFGALTLIGFSKFLESKGHTLLLLFSGLILSFVEYIGGIFTVGVLQHRAWDYSQNFANLGGHIDLWHGFLWMILGWFFVRYFHPVNKNFVEKILKINK